MSAAADPGALLFLVGPTASGKKQVALGICEPLGAELLSLDSMKVYREMDLGTDKSSARRFALTDLVDASARFSVGAWVRAARLEVAEVRGRGHLPLFVGGTGLYLRALVRGLFEVPDIAPAVREAVTVAIESTGVAAAHAELATVDPAMAARLHVGDRKRIARALEIFRQTGRTMTAWQAESTRRPIEGRARLVGIRWSRPRLRERIERRVERMFADGLVEEVRALRANGAIGDVAALAIGYREVVAMLEQGGDEAACAREVVRNTWKFVRRQDNWFRQFPEITWIEAEEDPATIAQRALAAFIAALRAA